MKPENAPTVLIPCPLCGAATQVSLPAAIEHANCGHEDAILAWLRSIAGRRYVAEYLRAGGPALLLCAA